MGSSVSNSARRALVLVAAFSLGLMSNSATAAEPDLAAEASDDWSDTIATDRPGNGNAATVVGAGRANVESSVAFSYDEPDTTPAASQITFPTVGRVGLLAPFELRFGTGLVGIEVVDGATTAAPADLFVGGKVQMTSASGAVPATALSFDVNVPSGEEPFTAGAVILDPRLAASWSLPAGFGILTNVGATAVQTDAGRVAQILYVGNFNYAPPFLEGRLGVFVEGFGRVGVDEGAQPSVHQIDWGAAWLFSPDTQVDFFLQHGLNDAAVDLQAAIGFSGRLR